MVKLCKLVHIVPDFLLGGVENMCAVSVHLDSLHILCVNVASDMITLVDYQTGLSLFGASWANTAPNSPAPTIK